MREAVQAYLGSLSLIAYRHQHPVCSNYGNQVVLTTGSSGSEWMWNLNCIGIHCNHSDLN